MRKRDPSPEAPHKSQIYGFVRKHAGWFAEEYGKGVCYKQDDNAGMEILNTGDRPVRSLTQLVCEDINTIQREKNITQFNQFFRRCTPELPVVPVHFVLAMEYRQAGLLIQTTHLWFSEAALDGVRETHEIVLRIVKHHVDAAFVVVVPVDCKTGCNNAASQFEAGASRHLDWFQLSFMCDNALASKLLRLRVKPSSFERVR